MYWNGCVCIQKEAAYHSGIGSRGIGGVSRNCIWLDGIYPDWNGRQYELLPFWSWREVICNHDRELLKENLLNFILLLPAGILLPLIANHKIKWYQALLIGILMSATIELSQLIFMRGLFEWDDMIHNGLGYMAGCLFTNFFVKNRVKH
ncbi:VanZ family protein [Eubacterium ramulus]|uniref:VanZ family protein n=1 Tax=Eubacterium ramulus TaxID=39490 RepID=UPI00300ED297